MASGLASTLTGGQGGAAGAARKAAAHANTGGPRTAHLARSAMVTGASTGIGQATVRRLAAAGWTVFAGVRRVEDGARLVLENPEGRVVPVQLDVTEHRQVDAAAMTVASNPAAVGGLSLLVNNAGQFYVGAVESLAIEHWRRQFEINLFGAVAVTQAFMPLVRRARGRIVNVSSIGGRLSQPLCGAYTASKFALEGATDALRIEVEGEGIKVILVEPGAVRTPIFDKALGGFAEAVSRVPEHLRPKYEPAIRTFRDTGERYFRYAAEPDAIARAIERAANARWPRTRYLVGRDAWLLRLLQLALPTRDVDWLLRRSAGLHRPAQVGEPRSLVAASA